MFLLIFLCKGDVINVYCFNFRVKIKILLCMGVCGCFYVKKKKKNIMDMCIVNRD